MALQFIFGNPGSGKSHYLYEHIIRESMKHPDINYIILVPEQFTMQTQKELVLRHPRHGIMNIDVLSFARLAFRVLEETGNGSREILDDEGKNLILRRLAGKKEDSLKVLKGNIKKPGYISEVKSVISELTQYNISPDGMDDMITEADESSYLAWKLKDIQVMYQAFEEYLADKYITKEEILDILCNVMDKSRMLKDSVIALDGFTGFTPLQNKVLGEMLHHCQKVMITVTMDKREDPYVMKDKYQLFALSKQMVTSLVKIAGEEKVLVEEPVCLYQEPVWRFRNAPALAFLEKELFRYSGRTYREKQSNVRVYAAANPRMEVECAAQRIRFLIRKKEYRYREIAVIASDMNLYADEIEKTFREYEIPVFMDYKRNVLLNSFVEYIRSLLAMAEQNFSAESVFRFLRTDLVGFTGEELDLLENYVLALGIRGYKKWQEKWIRRAKDTTEEELEVLNHLRVCFVEKTEELVFVLKQRQKTVRDVTLAICEFLEKEEIIFLLLVEHGRRKGGTSVQKTNERTEISKYTKEEQAKMVNAFNQKLDTYEAWNSLFVGPTTSMFGNHVYESYMDYMYSWDHLGDRIFLSNYYERQLYSVQSDPHVTVKSNQEGYDSIYELAQAKVTDHTLEGICWNFFPKLLFSKGDLAGAPYHDVYHRLEILTDTEYLLVPALLSQSRPSGWNCP